MQIASSFFKATVSYNKFKKVKAPYVTMTSKDGAIVTCLEGDSSYETCNIFFNYIKSKPTNEMKHELLVFYRDFCRAFEIAAESGLLDLMFAQVPSNKMDIVVGGVNAFKMVGKKIAAKFPFPVACAVNHRLKTNYPEKVKFLPERATQKKRCETEHEYFCRWMSLLGLHDISGPAYETDDDDEEEPEAKKVKTEPTDE